MELWNMATIFVLSFLGLVGIALLIFFLWLAYRYDISFTIRTREKAAPAPGPTAADPPATKGPMPAKDPKHESIS